MRLPSSPVHKITILSSSDDVLMHPNKVTGCDKLNYPYFPLPIISRICRPLTDYIIANGLLIMSKLRTRFNEIWGSMFS